MTLTKIPAELLGGPRCGHRLALYPFVGEIFLRSGKYIRGEEKTKGEAGGKPKGKAGGKPKEAKFKGRDIVSKTWVKVVKPSGVSATTQVWVDDTFPKPTDTPFRVTPSVLHEYSLTEGNDAYFAEDAAPPGRPENHPHIIELEKVKKET